MTIRVCQGEREMASDNKLLGNFDLVGIPPAPRGVPQVEVTFDIDANGIVNVSAKDKGTGKEQQIKIQASGGLSEEEIEKMVKEAEANAESDKKKRETVDVKNQADTMVHSAEKNLKEFGDKVSDQEKSAIENDVKTLKEAISSDDIEKIKTGLEALTQSSMKLGEASIKLNSKMLLHQRVGQLAVNLMKQKKTMKKLLMRNLKKLKKTIKNRKRVSLCQKETIMKFLAFPSQLMT